MINQLVSIIIPCYNVQSYIVECIESCYKQTHNNIEVICIDNNSSDNTWLELENLKKRFPYLIIDKEKKRGASSARNKGLKLAKGEWIQFLDADDIIINNKIENQLRFALEQDMEVVVSDRIIKNKKLDSVIANLTFENINKNVLETVISEILITGNPLYKKSIVEKIGGYNENLESSQDWDFHIRLALNEAKFGYLPGFFFITRMVSDSLSSDWIKVSRQACKVIDTLKKQLIKKDLSNNAVEKIQHLYYNSAIFATDKKEKDHFIKELIFWINYNNGKNSLSKIKMLFANTFGFKTLIFIESIRLKK